MKKIFYYSFILTAVSAILSCSEDEIIPEITFPEGSTDYFKTSVDFDNTSGEKSISFTSNVDWSASVDQTRDGSTWCTVSPSNGKAGQATINISVQENTTYDDRNAVVRLVYGDSIKSIFVNQKQLDALTLTSDRFEVPVSGGSVTVEVKSNIDYQVNIVNECKSWIHQSTTQNTRGLVASNLTFKIDPSQEYDKREGQIEIISGNKKEIVTVYQAGEGILTLTNKEFNLSSAEQDIAIEVSCNFEYSVDFPQLDWITENVAETRGVSTHTINLHVNENTSYDNREATLRIYDKNSELSEVIIIRQSQCDALLLEQKEYSFDENGGTFTVNVNANIDYEVQIGDSWVTEMPETRALVSSSHTFTVSEMTDNTPRETIITFIDSTTGIAEDVVIKQKNTFYLNINGLELTEEDNAQLSLTNETGLIANWESSDTSIATVDNEGNVKAIGKGETTIVVSTTDGKHRCECQITVKDITDFISAYYGGGSMVINNGLITYGSTLNWYFKNRSNSTVLLKSLQLVDGETGNAGNEMSIDEEVAGGETTGYSVRVGLLGIHIPVTCRYKYEHKGKTYTIEAVYSDSW